MNGIIKYAFPQVSDCGVGSYYSSDGLTINGFEWWIELGKEAGDKKGSHTLSFWIKLRQKNGDSVKRDWKCSADLELRLLRQGKPRGLYRGKRPRAVRHRITTVMTQKDSVGIYDFIDWKTMRDTRLGYCVSDTIFVEVIIREMMVFMLSRDLPDAKFVMDKASEIVTYDLAKTFAVEGLHPPDAQVSFRKIRMMGHRCKLSALLSFRQQLLSQPETEAGIKTLTLNDDTDLTGLLSILTLCYTNSLVHTPDLVIPLINAASLNRLPSIVKTCTLPSLLLPQHALSVMEIALMDRNWHLLRDSFAVFAKDASSLLQGREFPRISWTLLNYILKQEGMKCQEKQLLDASVKWALAECRRRQQSPNSIRTQLDRAFYKIRFPCLPLQDLHQLASHLLTPDELQNVLKYVTTKKLTRDTDLPFKTQPREPYDGS